MLRFVAILFFLGALGAAGYLQYARLNPPERPRVAATTQGTLLERAAPDGAVGFVDQLVAACADRPDGARCRARKAVAVEALRGKVDAEPETTAGLPAAVVAEAREWLSVVIAGVGLLFTLGAGGRR